MANKKDSGSKGGGGTKGNDNDRYVVRHPDGWAVKGPNSDRASSTHSTQAEAEAQAKKVVGNLGGGEVRVQDRQG